MLKFEILCVTMHQNDFSKLREMNVHSNIVYTNQTNYTSYEEIEFEKNHLAKMISTQTRGVGKNRNLGLLYASGDICLLSDDDVIYDTDMEKKVLSEFRNHPDADVIVFHFDSNNPERSLHKYTKTKKWSKFARNPWGAIRLAFKLESVRKSNVWFTTLFGGGSIFPSGEDSMWIKDLLKSNLKFYVSKETIGKVSFDSSTWFTGYNEKYYYGIGAYYAAQNKKTIFLRFIYTLLRTKNNKEMSICQKLHWMKRGKDGYKKMLSYNDYIELKK